MLYIYIFFSMKMEPYQIKQLITRCLVTDGVMLHLTGIININTLSYKSDRLKRDFKVKYITQK